MKSINLRLLAAAGGVLALPQAVHLAIVERGGLAGVLSGLVVGFSLAFAAFSSSSRQTKKPDLFVERP